MQKQKRRRSDRAGRPAMRSSGRPPVAGREEQQRFWKAIARGRLNAPYAVMGLRIALWYAPKEIQRPTHGRVQEEIPWAPASAVDPLHPT